MDKMDEILSVLGEIQADMGKIAAGRLKKEEPMEEEVVGMKIEAEPVTEDEIGEALEMDDEEEPMPRWKKRQMSD